MSPTRGSSHPPGPRLASPGPGVHPSSSAHAAPGARCALGSQRLRGLARTRPAPSQLPCGEPPAPSPLLFCPRRRRWGGGGLAPPVSATIPWPGRTKRPRGRTEATGRLGSSPKRIFAHGSRGSPPWHSLQRSEREAGAGKRTGREERVRGLKGQAGKTAGRGPTVEPAKVGVRNACLDGRQDLKGVPELRRQLRGNEGVPAREWLNFICAWTGRTPSARPPPGEPRRTETGSWVCWREPGAGRAGGEEPQGSASVIPSRAAVLELSWWVARRMEGAPKTAVARAAGRLSEQPAEVGSEAANSGRCAEERGLGVGSAPPAAGTSVCRGPEGSADGRSAGGRTEGRKLTDPHSRAGASFSFNIVFATEL